MPETRVSLTAVYEPVENGWIQARIEELPAVITAGPTVEEARELLLDALREYLTSLGGPGGQVLVHEPARREALELILSA